MTKFVLIVVKGLSYRRLKTNISLRIDIATCSIFSLVTVSVALSLKIASMMLYTT